MNLEWWLLGLCTAGLGWWFREVWSRLDWHEGELNRARDASARHDEQIGTLRRDVDALRKPPG